MILQGKDISLREMILKDDDDLSADYSAEKANKNSHEKYLKNTGCSTRAISGAKSRLKSTRLSSLSTGLKALFSAFPKFTKGKT